MGEGGQRPGEGNPPRLKQKYLPSLLLILIGRLRKGGAIFFATGIGLFMAKAIIEKGMGGSLTVRNVAGGAEFRIEV
jgi:hypothetical protein